MSDADRVSPADLVLPRPRALVLDFGGVVVSTESRPEWIDEVSREVHRQLLAAGIETVPLERVKLDLTAGRAADRAWKDAMSRPFAPSEMTHTMFWGDFVAADWPSDARSIVLAHATALCAYMGERRSKRFVRPALEKLLDTAELHGIRVGIASNALAGVVHRQFLESVGLDRRFGVQVYSDEVSIRKPNPELVLMACRALGTPPEQTWYVGDNFDRDVVCGRRANVGAVILMEARSTYSRPYEVHDQPDAVVADPSGLLTLLERAQQATR